MILLSLLLCIPADIHGADKGCGMIGFWRYACITLLTWSTLKQRTQASSTAIELIGGMGNETVKALACDELGCWLAGETTISEDSHPLALLARYDIKDNTFSPYTLGSNSRTLALAENNQNTFFIGHAVHQEIGIDLLVVAKLSQSGPLWLQAYTPFTDPRCYGAAGTKDDGCVVACAYNNGTQHDIHLFKIGPIGEIIWSKVMGTPWDDDIHDLVVSPSGHIGMVGSSTMLSQNKTLFVYHINGSSGAQLWGRRVTTIGHIEGYGIDVDINGTFSIVGSKTSLAAKDDILLARITATGVWEFIHGFGGENDDNGYRIKSFVSGISLIGATKSYGEGGTTMLSATFDSSGYLDKAMVFLGGDYGRAVDLSTAGNDTIVVVGNTLEESDRSIIWATFYQEKNPYCTYKVTPRVTNLMNVITLDNVTLSESLYAIEPHSSFFIWKAIALPRQTLCEMAILALTTMPTFSPTLPPTTDPPPSPVYYIEPSIIDDNTSMAIAVVSLSFNIFCWGTFFVLYLIEKKKIQEAERKESASTT